MSTVQISIPTEKIMNFANNMGVLPYEAAQALGADESIVQKLKDQDLSKFLDENNDEVNFVFE